MNDSRYIIQNRMLDGTEEPRTIHRAIFADLIAQYFKLTEIHTLAFNLPLDKENIEGHTKKSISENLIETCANRGLLQELWELCKKERPNVTWGDALEPVKLTPTQPSSPDLSPIVKQTKDKQRNRLVAGLLIAVAALLGFGGAWLVWGNGREANTDYLETTPEPTQIVEVTRVLPVTATPAISDIEHITPVSRPITTTGSVLYSFEDEEIPPWDYSETIGEKIITDTISLVGNHSLAFKPNLTARESSDQTSGSASFFIDLPDPIHDQLSLFRIYIPTPPRNLFMQTVIIPDEGERLYYPGFPVSSGQWVTIARSTSDVPTGFTPEKIGLQFALEWPNDANTAYCVNDGSPPKGHEDEKCLEDVFIYVDAVEIIPQNTQFFKTVSASSESIYFGFENDSVPNWQFSDEQITGSPQIVSAEVYDGKYALAYDVAIRSRDDNGDDKAAASITLTNEPMKDKAVIFHVFVPRDAPTNLAGQFSLSSRGVYGKYTSLTPGEWTTIAWMTSDSPEWEGDPDLEFHIILGRVDENIEGHRAGFVDKVYIDDIEIFPMYRNYDDARPLASILEVTKIYRFEYTSDLEEIEPINEYITDVVLSTYNNIRNVLQLEMQLPGHDFAGPVEQNAGGISLSPPSEDVQPIDAMSAVIFVPEDSEGEFKANFVAIEQQDDGNIERRYSPDYQLTPGKWTPIFWGTDDASWNPNAFDGFELWLANSENYEGGEIYIDTVAFYRRHEP